MPTRGPPWWILRKVKPEGPNKSMGTWTAITFSKTQQAKFGINEDGVVVDQMRFDAAFALEVTPDVKLEVKSEVNSEAKSDANSEVKCEVESEMKPEVKLEEKPEVKYEIKSDMKLEAKSEVKPEVKSEVKTEESIALQALARRAISRSSDRSRSPRSRQDRAAEDYHNKLIDQLACELVRSGRSLEAPFLSSATSNQIGMDEFRQHLEDIDSSLSADDIQTLFLKLATIDVYSFCAAVGDAKKKRLLETMSPGLWSILSAVDKTIDSSGLSRSQAFDKIDKNGDGVLDANELFHLVAELHSTANSSSPLDMTEFYNAVSMLDTNSDGKISRTEFCHGLDAARAKAAAIVLKRHVYNARGGAPPYRGSYLTATDEVTLDANVPLSEQQEKLIPDDGMRMSSSIAEIIAFSGRTPPKKWETLGASDKRLSVDLFDRTAAEIFDSDGMSVVVLLPMRGMD